MKTKSVVRSIGKGLKLLAKALEVFKKVEAAVDGLTKTVKAEKPKGKRGRKAKTENVAKKRGRKAKAEAKPKGKRGRPAAVKTEKVTKKRGRPAKAKSEATGDVKKVPLDELGVTLARKLLKTKQRGEKARGRAPNPQMVALAALYEASELASFLKNEPDEAQEPVEEAVEEAAAEPAEAEPYVGPDDEDDEDEE